MSKKQLFTNIALFNNFKENWESTMYILLLSGFTCSLFLPLLFTNIFTILLFAFTFVIVIKRKGNLPKNGKLRLFTLLLLYVAYCIGMLHSNNVQEGVSSLEVKLSLLLFPIIFFFNIRLDQAKVNKILSIFVVAANLAAMFCLAKALYLTHPIISGSQFNWESITYHNLAGTIGFHAIYLSMYICFALMIILLRWADTNGTKRILAAASWLFLSLFLLLLSARIVLLAYVFLTLFYTIYYAYRKQALLKLVLFYSIALLAAAAVAYNIPPLKNRIKEAINYNSEYSIDKQWGGRALRLLKWQCCVDIISQHPIIGVGTGSEQDRLQECYVANDFTPLLFWQNIKYNAHNQYFQTALAIGVLGLIVLVANLILSAGIAVKEKRLLFLSFVVIISLCFITESMLQVNKGVVFYAFFNSFFLFSYQRN